MKSATKTYLREDMIKAIAERFLEEEKNPAAIEGIRELKGGMFNAAYEIRLEKGCGYPHDAVILKIGVRSGTKVLSYEKDLLRSEVANYHALEKAELPVPKILFCDYSRVLVESDYFIMTKINGCPWSEIYEEVTEENREALKEQLGRYNAAIHSVRGTYFGYPKQDNVFHHQTWSQAFGYMMGLIITDGKNENTQLPYEKIDKIMERCRAILDEIKEPQLVNFDLWAGNILLTEKDGWYEIEGIIDLERGYYGDPYADFCASVMAYEDVEEEKAFQRGYESYTGEPFRLTQNDRIRIELYRLYLGVIMCVEVYRYSEEEARGALQYAQGKVNKALERLEQFLQ